MTIEAPKTQAEAVAEEVGRAMRDLADAGFTEEQSLAMCHAMEHMHSAVSLNAMDARAIEGDDEAEILGY